MSRVQSKSPPFTLYFFVFIATVPLIYFGYKLTLSTPAGYCNSQERYISDDEFIKASAAALEWKSNRQVTSYPEGTTGKLKEISSWYKNLDFNLENPNCCLVIRNDPLLGSQEIEVWLNSKTSIAPVTPSDYQIRFFFDTCGKLIDSDIGLPDTELRIITTTSIMEKHN
ncbi:hypothetical protein [Pseudomonas sp. 2FE]|uniref:hypothetical protein n=1 Tax=Pseudomonas sp. 2FE TaxID=2502190 RepID=UPI0010F4ED15|nr:hypothetical protein [Pseudomonas sp. 2FE]